MHANRRTFRYDVAFSSKQLLADKRPKTAQVPSFNTVHRILELVWPACASVYADAFGAERDSALLGRILDRVVTDTSISASPVVSNISSVSTIYKCSTVSGKRLQLGSNLHTVVNLGLVPKQKKILIRALIEMFASADRNAEGMWWL